MAAVHGPTSYAQQPEPFKAGPNPNANVPPSRRNFNPAAQQTHPSRSDPFFGHEKIAKLCARFITHIFACPEDPPLPPSSSANPSSAPPPPQPPTVAHAKLPFFIAYALHRTKLHPSVTFASLVLLQRLKARFPSAKGSSGHRLFLSAFMISSKVICDDTYSNKSWAIVGQNLFALREVNQMEREMCAYLEWELNVDAECLESFEKMVRKDFASERGPYPTYVLRVVPDLAGTGGSKARVSLLTASGNGGAEAYTSITSSSSPIPSFAHASRPHPHIQTSTTTTTSSSLHPSSSTGTTASSSRSANSSPSTSNTPSPSYTATTSPANSASPTTPNTYSPGPYAHIYAPGPQYASLASSAATSPTSCPAPPRSSNPSSRENSISENYIYRPRPEFADASARALSSIAYFASKNPHSSHNHHQQQQQQGSQQRKDSAGPGVPGGSSALAFSNMEWRKGGDWGVLSSKRKREVVVKKEEGAGGTGVYAYASPAVW